MTLCINPRCPNPQNSDNAQFCQSCQSSLLLKQRYRAMKVLGRGGFGTTYEASDLGNPNKVIKVLINNSPKAVELFQREAEVLSQLNNPGIPKVEPNSYIVFHPANSPEPVHCLVMEKVEGMNLRDYLKRLGHPIDSETADRWLRELVLILQAVHDRGILHRDIKPQNIIFKPDGRLALIDFGAVREGTGTEVATAAGSGGGTEVASHMAGGTSVVSRGYTAPEQVNGQAVKQSDFYSLGRTFVFLLTGKEPSEIPYDAHNDVLQWRKYASNVEPRLAGLLDQMQSPKVSERPKNSQEILGILGSEKSQTALPKAKLEPTPIRPSGKSISSKPPSLQPPQRPQQKTQLFGILALLGVGIVGTGAFVISQNNAGDVVYPPPSPSNSVASDYPKPTCGSGDTSYQVYIDNSSQIDDIKSRFCKDAWVNTYEGRSVVQVAQFGSEADAQNFVSFLQQNNVSNVFHSARTTDNQTSSPEPSSTSSVMPTDEEYIFFCSEYVDGTLQRAYGSNTDETDSRINIIENIDPQTSQPTYKEKTTEIQCTPND